jgi:hypothetical protein
MTTANDSAVGRTLEAAGVEFTDGMAALWGAPA